MNTLLAIGNLAKAVQDAGDLDEASALFERSYAGQVQTLGEEHPQSLISSAANIAVLYAMKKQPEKAFLKSTWKILEVQETNYWCRSLLSAYLHEQHREDV